MPVSSFICLFGSKPLFHYCRCNCEVSGPSTACRWSHLVWGGQWVPTMIQTNRSMTVSQLSDDLDDLTSFFNQLLNLEQAHLWLAVIIPIKRDRVPLKYVSPRANNFRFLSTGQRLEESMRPYLEELREMWPWLLLTFACGGVASVVAAAAVLTAKHGCRGLSLPHAQRWKMWKLSLPERLPLLWGSDREESSQPNYQTTIWKHSRQLCKVMNLKYVYNKSTVNYA